jgi:hypothetical protein
MKTRLQITLLSMLNKATEDAWPRLLCGLEPYFSLFPDTMLRSQAEVWRDRATYLRDERTDISTLIFCLCDGLKVLLMRGKGDVFLVVLRSALEDASYQQDLANFLHCEAGELGRRFVEVPPFELETVSALRKTFCEMSLPGPTDVSWQELSKLANWYRRPNGSTYALDIRVFAVMRALRHTFCDLALHVILIERQEPDQTEGALTRLYVYHTREAIPQRPPIYACCSTRAQLEALEEARARHEEKVEPSDSFVAKAAQRIGGFRFRAPIHVFVFDTADRRSSALLEISGVHAGVEDVWLGRRAIEAAIDPTDNRAVELLARCAVLATPRQARDFNRLLFIFSHALSSAQGPETEADKAWTCCLETLRQAVAEIPSGSLPLAARSQLVRLVQSFRTNGNRGNFNPAAFEKSMSEFNTNLASSRSSMRLLPQARTSAPAKL